MDINMMKDLYFKWIDKSIKFSPSKNNDYVVVTTPFLDIYNDYIEVIIFKGKSNKFVISDDGYTLDELGMLEINLDKKSKRRDYFLSILYNFGVKEINGELMIEFSSIKEFPNVQNRLVQCMIQVFDLLQTTKNKVIRYFKEDVSNYFIENAIPVSEGLSFTGRSGKDSKFDIIVGRTKSKPQQAIKVVNKPTTNNIANPLFRIIDVRDEQPNTDFSVIVNNIDTSISGDFQSAFDNYDVPIYTWSDKNEWINKFKVI